MLSESTLVSIWHPSDGAEGQGQGQLLIKTVKLAFSVTNNVIRLKPPSNVVSPLEQALTQHGMYRSLTSRASAHKGILQAVLLETSSIFSLIPGENLGMSTSSHPGLRNKRVGTSFASASC